MTTFQELIELDGTLFLSRAYLALLGRPVDPEGFKAYDARLRAGVPRLQILAELSASAEARAYGAQIQGLSEALAAHRVPHEYRPANADAVLGLEGEAFLQALHLALHARAPAAGDIERGMCRLVAGTPRVQLLAEAAASVGSEAERRLPGSQSLVERLRSGIFPVASSIEDLLRYDDVAFVDCAYKTLLRRWPDPPGLWHYTERLRAGASKMAVVARLARSPEGRRANVTLPGAAAAVRQYLIGLLPVVGPLVRALTHVEGESASERRLRAVDNKMHRLLRTAALRELDEQACSRQVEDLLVLQRTASLPSTRP